MSTTRHEPTYLDPDALRDALALRDLTDPAAGPHAMQQLLDLVVAGLRGAWDCSVRIVRTPPVVSVRDNYDRLRYRSDDVTRDRRYTRYVSPTTMLRSHTTAELPRVLDETRGRRGVDELVVVPGVVYRRDVVDRTHVGEPHQVDLWRVRSVVGTTADDLADMVARVVDAVLPSARWRLVDAVHPYTVGGRQVDVWHDGQWLELAECGLIHPDVLWSSGLRPDRWSGLALGMGLDRALMLRKGIPDIRYLRSRDPRVLAQLNDLDPWQAVSALPAARRDLSVVLGPDADDESVGDAVRTALGVRSEVLESVRVVGSTPAADLPEPVRRRLGITAGQSNALVRIVLRPLDRTLTSREADEIRDVAYRAIHVGPYLELASRPDPATDGVDAVRRVPPLRGEAGRRSGRARG